MLRNRHHQTLLGLFVISIAIAPAAQAADGTCGVDSLKGRYGFQASGRVDGPSRTETDLDLTKTETVHFAQVGTLEADGKGHAWLRFTESANTTTPATARQGATYTVNPDCTGTLRFTVDDAESDTAADAPGYAFVLKPDHAFSFIGLATGTVLTGSAWLITDAAGEPVPVAETSPAIAAQRVTQIRYRCGTDGCPPDRVRVSGTNYCIPCD
ncbi:hypothetical protein sS8_3470 [Methylocaldum marinum]|uniref:Uncharacterized protein n=1 Tax=Methylocaldum marinum TaxID=1432792 RepID=A0A250KUW4_9GAMM|nr:hypothetical protein [Methylocaldum marinum]BBA35407.1 hypothetical protein sS8_3470 [Methylocaldum marinum]